MTASPLKLRPYKAGDEDAAIELWRRSWQVACPHLDFTARIGWWRERWRNELVPRARIVVAETGGVLEGLVTIEPDTGYLDQLVVAPEFWGSNIGTLLMDEAKRISPTKLDLLVNKEDRKSTRLNSSHRT